MGLLSRLFKKKDKPAPYDWGFLKEQCLMAIGSKAAPVELKDSTLGDLDFERLEASDEGAEDVVVEIWAVLKNAKAPSFSSTQAQEYLFHAAELLRTDITVSAAAVRLREIEERVRKRHVQ
jgi:hypothetical protein